MITVEMQMDVWGVGVNVYPLCRLSIVNDGTGTKKLGNYDVTVFSKAGNVMRTGRVESWPRLRKHPVDLLAAATAAVTK